MRVFHAEKNLHIKVTTVSRPQAYIKFRVEGKALKIILQSGESNRERAGSDRKIPARLLLFRKLIMYFKVICKYFREALRGE
jgi:hypothetical protein